MITGTKKILGISLFSLFALIIFIYAVFTARGILFGIKIKNVLINGQEAGTFSKIGGQIIEISGRARNATHLYLNGLEISTDKERNWRESVALLPGLNIVNIKARDKFGNTDEKSYQLIY